MEIYLQHCGAFATPALAGGAAIPGRKLILPSSPADRKSPQFRRNRPSSSPSPLGNPALGLPGLPPPMFAYLILDATSYPIDAFSHLGDAKAFLSLLADPSLRIIRIRIHTH